MSEVFESALRRSGVPAQRARAAAEKTRQIYCHPVNWRVLSGAKDALRSAREAGWRNIIVSNHIPELAGIIDHLDLSAHVTTVISSALIGWEKPHENFFAHVQEHVGHPAVSWMVGDNPIADGGFVRHGAPCILVHPRTGVGPLQAARMIIAEGAVHEPIP